MIDPKKTSNDPATPDLGIGLRTVRLTGRKVQLVPDNIEVLNPEEEGRKSNLYFTWPIDPLRLDWPNTLTDCIEGLGMGPAFGWLTDFEDLYKLGRHDRPMDRARFEAALKDHEAMVLALAEAMDRILPADTCWTFAWTMCDCLGGGTPVGTAPYMITSRGPKETR